MTAQEVEPVNGRSHSAYLDVTRDGLLPPSTILKRDGRLVAFDIERIENALTRCFASLNRKPQTSVPELARRVVNIIAAKSKPATPTVEGVQDIVEMVLQAAGEFEAAKRYILYRAEHAQKRIERPIPEKVRLAFAESDQYFPSPLQKFQFFDKYSRFNYDLGRRETWIETVDRSVDFLYELAGARLPSETYDRIRRNVLEMRSMPSMRLLAMAGAAARRNNVAIYNCLSGDEKILTHERGLIALRDSVGTVTVLNKNREWVPAEVRSFGQQQTVEIEFGRYKSKKVIRTTLNHDWVLTDGRRTTTEELRPGDEIAYTVAPRAVNTGSIDYRLGLMHGIIYGDGAETYAQERNNGYLIRLCGDSRELLECFAGYPHSFPPTYGGDPVVYLYDDFAKTHQLKALPNVAETDDYLVGFIRGWFAADGHLSKQGQILFAADEAGEEFLRRVGPKVGFDFGYAILLSDETNYGIRNKKVRNVEVRRASVSEEDFLLSKHLRNYREATTDRDWKFLSVVPGSSRVEEVFCATVPETHTFALADGIVTGNCSYQPVESIDSFVEALTISMSGCGVGFSVESRYVENFPRIKRQTGTQHELMVVEDSAEGWANALRTGLETWFEGSDIRFDLSQLRQAGAALKTKGGRASGPEPLRVMLDFVRARVLARQGSFLRPIDGHDMMCAVGNAAVSGGVRRTAMISLFDHDDDEMRLSKNGDFERDNNQRWNANNSAVWPDGGRTQVEYMHQFLEMVESGRGEPGIFNRESALSMRPERRQEAEFGTNPCGEILLRPFQFCNLSAAVARKDDTFESLRDKVEVAAIIGSIQSLATYFPGLRPQWKQNCDEERLLGVDITGQMDSPIAQDAEVKAQLRQIAVEVNRQTAAALGINQSAAITCVKPSGNSSQLLDCSSGLHSRWAPYYVRNVRVATHSPLYKVLRDASVPMDPENGQTPEDANTWVIHFPVKAPEGSVTRDDRSAIQQCEFWLQNKLHWTEHNPSCFAGDTRIITDRGLMSFHQMEDYIGDNPANTPYVLGKDGAWVTATFRSLGEQEIWELVVERCGIQHTIRTTKDHQWPITSPMRRFRGSTLDLRTTNELPIGSKDYKLLTINPDEQIELDLEGILHGITFGDGTRGSGHQGRTRYCSVALCNDPNGVDSRELASFFMEAGYAPNVRDDRQQIQFYGLPEHWKQLPTLDESPEYLRGFIAGWFAADGHVGHTTTISSVRRDALEWLQVVAPRAGLATPTMIGEHYSESGVSPVTWYTLALAKETLDHDFFLLAAKRERFTTAKFAKYWKIVSVRATGKREPVYCMEVQEAEPYFVLEGNILTHNCTITYRPDEVLDVMKWVWEHRDQIGGLSFLPAFDAKYDNMPYVEITREEFEQRAAAFPEIDFSKVYRYEEEDLTNAAQELACSSGYCEIDI